MVALCPTTWLKSALPSTLASSASITNGALSCSRSEKRVSRNTSGPKAVLIANGRLLWVGFIFSVHFRIRSLRYCDRRLSADFNVSILLPRLRLVVKRLGQSCFLQPEGVAVINRYRAFIRSYRTLVFCAEIRIWHVYVLFRVPMIFVRGFAYPSFKADIIYFRAVAFAAQKVRGHHAALRVRGRW